MNLLAVCVAFRNFRYLSLSSPQSPPHKLTSSHKELWQQLSTSITAMNSRIEIALLVLSSLKDV